MSEFLEKSKERKIRLQKERQDVQKTILEQIQVKETKKKSLAGLLTQKDSELEHLLKQFKTEDAKIVQQIGIMDETMKSISEFREKSVDQTDMLSEDQASTNSLKQGLVFQREELETFVTQLKSQVKGWSPELQKAFDEDKDQGRLVELIVSASAKKLILDLIQELQQYILTYQSGTTDASSAQSDTLEVIENGLESGQLSVQESLRQVVELA